MADTNTERESELTLQGSRQNRSSQSATAQTGRSGQRGGLDFSLIFPLNSHDLHDTGRFERCWWVSAPQRTH
jgi:hypothetical protein